MMQSERGAIGDDDRRKTPLYAVVAYIRAQRPRLFVLENVRALGRLPSFGTPRFPIRDAPVQKKSSRI